MILMAADGIGNDEIAARLVIWSSQNGRHEVW